MRPYGVLMLSACTILWLLARSGMDGLWRVCFVAWTVTHRLPFVFSVYLVVLCLWVGECGGVKLQYNPIRSDFDSPSSVRFFSLTLRKTNWGFFLFLFLFTWVVCLWRTRNPDHLDTSVKTPGWLTFIHHIRAIFWYYLGFGFFIHPLVDSLFVAAYDAAWIKCFNGQSTVWPCGQKAQTVFKVILVYILPLWSSTILLTRDWIVTATQSFGMDDLILITADA